MKIDWTQSEIVKRIRISILEIEREDGSLEHITLSPVLAGDDVKDYKNDLDNGVFEAYSWDNKQKIEVVYDDIVDTFQKVWYVVVATVKSNLFVMVPML